MRVRTTNSIFGFNIGGALGDEYKEEITVNYKIDDGLTKMDAYPQ
jgi:hypothetical protein